MKREDNAYTRWEKMSKYSRKFYIFIRYPFFRILPIQIILVLINDLPREEISMRVLWSTLFKLVAGYEIGCMIGSLEWKFTENLVKEKYETVKEIKQRYTFIYGILFCGLNMIIALYELIITPLWGSLILIPLSIITGWILSLFMWGINCSDAEKYLKKNQQLNEYV